MFFKKQKKYSEKELIEGCINGNESCYKQLYETFYGKMLNVCKRYAKDNEEAKDIVQDGFVRVFKNLHKYNFKGSLEGWIRRVIVNSAINHYHEQIKHRVIDYRERIQDNEMGGVFYSMEGELSFDVNYLLEAVQQLPETYRMVFNLNEIEGFSHKEISNMLNITESTSRSNLTKAKQKLKHTISGLLKETA